MILPTMPIAFPGYDGEFKEADYACIHPDGHRTEIWYSAQQVISEFKKFENIFLKFRWKGIMPVCGTQANRPSIHFDELGEYISSHSNIQAISAKQDLLIGCFEDEEGNTGLVLLNFSDPYEKKENPITLTLNTNEEIAVIKNGETEIVSLVNGCYEAVLAPSEGQFVIIPNEESAKITITKKDEPVPAYLVAPKSYHWKECFGPGNHIDTYNVYGSGNSHFEFIEEDYPEGGSGRVVRCYTTTCKDRWMWLLIQSSLR